VAELRVCALYPELMNIYADRGNILMLERRCRWRGIAFAVTAAGLGEPIDPDAHDLFYLGGGQDRDQRLCALDLVETKRDALHAAAARGALVLGVCGGYQLLGHRYALGDEEIPGIGLVDLETVRSDRPRLIGNVAIEVQLDGDGPRVLAGFENHAGRTHLGAGEAPLGRVLRGHGNTGSSGAEGRRHVPPRAAAAEERVVRRLAHPPGDRSRRARAARRPLGGRRPRRGTPRGRDLDE
jgi:CobQ-like glutamine amidotransferase family enzyme